MSAREVSGNARTLAAYETHAETYRDQTGSLVTPSMDALLTTLAERSPAGPVLEIGSAHGRDACRLEALGRTVRRTDAARAFVAMLRADGHATDVVDVLTDDLTGEGQGPYAAVLANAVFHHFTPSQLGAVLGKVRTALVDAGLLGFTVKRGGGAEWSEHKLGAPRYFHYYEPGPLTDLLERAGFEVVDMLIDPGRPRDWIRVLATPATDPA